MSNKTGVIVGRFQNFFIHEGHQNIISRILSENDVLVVFIGTSEVVNTRRNPLPYGIVADMLTTYLKSITNKPFYIHAIKDLNDDKLWSKLLDDMISALISKNSDVTLYGSRDSFLTSYSGTNKVVHHESSVVLSASEFREKIQIENDPSFRKGMIYASQIRYPTVYSTVDIVSYFILRDKIHFVLGIKKNSKTYCLPGGFSDPLYDTSFDEAALREAKEETSLVTHKSNLKYFGSRLINDYRYQRECDKIITTIFVTKLSNEQVQSLKAGDDLKELMIVSEDELDNFPIYNDHKQIIIDVLSDLKKNINVDSETPKYVTILLKTGARIEDVLLYKNQLYVPFGVTNDEISQILK